MISENLNILVAITKLQAEKNRSIQKTMCIYIYIYMHKSLFVRLGHNFVFIQTDVKEMLVTKQEIDTINNP